MEHREYESLANRETFYFWHVGRRELLAELLKKYLPEARPRSILDIGCGTGGDMLLLAPLGNVIGLDSSAEALRLSESKGFHLLKQGSAEALPLEDNSIDLVVALDVLEHIPNDEKATQEVLRVLRKGGIFLVTVPAYQWLWSQHDIALHHQRRYWKPDLCRMLRSRGFTLRYSSYFVVLGMCMNGLRKLIDRVRGSALKSAHVYDVVYPPFMNFLLLSVLRVERLIMRFSPIPFGSSIVVVAQKPL